MFDKFENKSSADKRRMLHCNDCGHRAIHNLEAGVKGSSSDDESMISAGTEFSIYRCGGCDSVIFVIDDWNSEYYYHDDEGNTRVAIMTKQYPSISSSLSKIDTSDCPEGIKYIIREAASSLDHNNLLSATIMARMTIEEICNNSNIAGNNLKIKINNLAHHINLDQDQKELLHEIRERGNKGAHEAKMMSADEIAAGFEVLSVVIDKEYSAPARAKRAVRNAKRKLKPQPQI